MREFDYVAAWHHGALPAWKDLILHYPGVKEMAWDITNTPGLVQRSDLTVPIPPVISERCRRLDTFTLARISKVAYCWGHWKPGLRLVDTDSPEGIVEYGPTTGQTGWNWKLANMLDQIIVERLGAAGVVLTKPGRFPTGLSLVVREGVLELQYNSSQESRHISLGLADEICGKSIAPLLMEGNLDRAWQWCRGAHEPASQDLQEWRREIWTRQMHEQLAEVPGRSIGPAGWWDNLSRLQSWILGDEDWCMIKDKTRVWAMVTFPDGEEKTIGGFSTCLTPDVELAIKIIRDGWLPQQAKREVGKALPIGSLVEIVRGDKGRSGMTGIDEKYREGTEVVWAKIITGGPLVKLEEGKEDRGRREGMIKTIGKMRMMYKIDRKIRELELELELGSGSDPGPYRTS